MGLPYHPPGKTGGEKFSALVYMTHTLQTSPQTFSVSKSFQTIPHPEKRGHPFWNGSPLRNIKQAGVAY